jgi:hypothetical protein
MPVSLTLTGMQTRIGSHQEIRRIEIREDAMKRALLIVLCLASTLSCTKGSEVVLTGTWKITAKGVDSQNNPCPFVPEEITFFKDGTVSMSNMPPGMKMFFKTALTGEEARAVMEKFAYLKDKDHILLMRPSAPTDWINSMAYDYSLKGNELTLFLPGWTASTYGRK